MRETKSKYSPTSDKVGEKEVNFDKLYTRLCQFVILQSRRRVFKLFYNVKVVFAISKFIHRLLFLCNKKVEKRWSTEDWLSWVLT